MTSRRLLGYVLVIIGILFILGIVGQLPELFRILSALVSLVTGKLDSFAAGEVIGNIIFWLVYFLITIVLWKYGLRWSRKKAALHNSSNNSIPDETSNS